MREMACKENSFGSYSTSREDKFWVLEIMDQCWFFHNLFDETRKYRDSIDVSFSNRRKENSISKSNLPGLELIGGHILAKDPCLQAFEEDMESTSQSKECDRRAGSSNLRRSLSSLSDGPSLSSRGNGHDSSKDIISQMDSQNTIRKPNIPRHRPRQESNADAANKDCKNHLYATKKPKCRKVCYRRRWKSLSDLEFEEIQGFMDLGFIFNKEQMTPTIQNMIPGLQDKRSIDENKVTRPYLSEAWYVQRPDHPKLNWVGRKSGVDVEGQLRIWARVVASNVHQEC